ncbi:MAG: DUF4344 domain-containing metallopeptidase [Deltaproteobacteria bacterium]|nr:DUF4344 domain-containing metallopeptidase [Deltaproteobacteria bacterium]
MRWVLSMAFVSVVAAGCDKKSDDGKKDEASAKVADKAGKDDAEKKDKTDKSDAKDKKKKKKKGDKVLGGNDPWSVAARGGEGGAQVALAKNDTVAAKVGEDFAQITPMSDPSSLPKSADKIDFTRIEKAAPDKLAIKGFGGATTNGFKVVYNPSRNATHEQFRKVFEENRVFESVAAGLNKTIRLPTSIDINTVDCGTVNAFYDPNSKRIIVCYELLDYFLGVFKPTLKDETELGNAVLGATIFSFFHETGHGLIDILDLPAVGREEDSADQLATLILMSSGDEGVQMALSGAYWFQLQSKGGEKTPFWDEHAFNGQRFYNVLCMIYGSDPDKYAGFVSSNNLPKDRAVRCREEYGKIKKGWEKLLQPHLTNGAAINIDYKPPVDKAEAPRTSERDPWDQAMDVPGAAEPAAPPTPVPAKKGGGITCEAVAMKAAELIGAAAMEKAKTLSPDEVEELRAKLEAELPAAMEQLLSECAKAGWSQPQRACVVNARDLDQAMKCQ